MDTKVRFFPDPPVVENKGNTEKDEEYHLNVVELYLLNQTSGKLHILGIIGDMYLDKLVELVELARQWPDDSTIHSESDSENL